MGSYLPMERSSSYFRSLGYMARRGLTKTKTILLTARYVEYLILSIRRADLQYTSQIINLPQSLLIVDYLLGHTGSVHDTWAFQSTRTFKNHNKIFGPGKWMWADSAYPPETWSIAPFKKPINGQLTADQRTYNYWVSKVSCTLCTTR